MNVTNVREDAGAELRENLFLLDVDELQVVCGGRGD